MWVDNVAEVALRVRHRPSGALPWCLGPGREVLDHRRAREHPGLGYPRKHTVRALNAHGVSRAPVRSRRRPKLYIMALPAIAAAWEALRGSGGGYGWGTGF